MKNKQRGFAPIGIVLILIGMVAVGGGGYLYVKQKSITDIEKKELVFGVSQELATTTNKESDDLYNEATTSINENAVIKPVVKKEAVDIDKICSAHKTEIFKHGCYFVAAIDQLSIDVCKKIPTNDYQQGCKDSVNLSLAYTKKDSTYCLTSGSYKSRCLEKIARLTGDVSNCSDNSCKVQAKIFLAVKNKDKTICDGFSFDGDKNKCYGELGVALNDTSLCELAKNETVEGEPLLDFQGFERPTCYKELAKINANTTYCDKIDFGNWGEGCTREVLAIKDYLNQCKANEKICLTAINQAIDGADACDLEINEDTAYSLIAISNCYQKAEEKCSNSLLGSGSQTICSNITNNHFESTKGRVDIR